MKDLLVDNPQYFVFNQNAELLDQPRTIICTGMGRSGTSAVMSLLEFLGLWVGALPHSRNRENKELRKAISENDEVAQALIVRYDQQFPIWGFKAPSIRRNLAKTMRLFRNPMLIIPHRDPVGKLGRHMISQDRQVTLADIDRVIVSQRRLIQELANVSAPQLHIAFPLLTGNPERALRAISDFVGLEIPPGDLATHMGSFRNRYLSPAKPGKEKADRVSATA